MSDRTDSPAQTPRHRVAEQHAVGGDAELASALRLITANCGRRARQLLLGGHRHLPRHVILQLSRTSPERQRFELTQVNAGRRPFSTKSTVFDTINFAEVGSRLARGGGLLHMVACRLALARRDGEAFGNLRSLRQTADALRRECGELYRLIRASYARRPPDADDSAAGFRWSEPRLWDEGALRGKGPGDVCAALNVATAFVGKCARDLGTEDLVRARGLWPSRAQTHSCCVRLLAMVRDAWRILDLLQGEESRPRRKTIATHAGPDADALAAAWLAERHLFADERAEVVFLPRTLDLSRGRLPDCVVDMAGLHDAGLLFFDHKPPAFSDRNETCTTRLLWAHLLALGRPVAHLAGLVDVVHEGDSSPPRAPSPALARSRRAGLHALVARLRARGASDADVYRAARRWLDRLDARARVDGPQQEGAVERKRSLPAHGPPRARLHNRGR
jgi:hypothetical protein